MRYVRDGGRVALVALATLMLPFTQARASQQGALDPTWARDSPQGPGKVMTSIGGSNDSAHAIALQPDGKVLVTGTCYNGNYEFCVLRYNANGTLDTSWSGTGTVITPMGAFEDGAFAIAVQPDGKVLVAGTCQSAYRVFCAVRYNANGSLDPGWNGTGKVMTQIAGNNGSSNATAMALQPDGKVLLAGYCAGGTNNDDFCALRYQVDGTLDRTWNGTGKVITPIGTSTDDAHAIALQTDGKVLLAGRCFAGTNNEFCVLRYRADGTLDTDWNGTGRVMSPIGSGSASAAAIAVQSDGKVLVAGECWSGTASAFCMLRYQTDGNPDLSWNGSGKTITQIGSGGFASSLAVQRDGKVLVAGECFSGTTDFCTVRYNADGTLDTTWGAVGTGKVITPIASSHDQAFAMALQPDGKVLLAGGCINSSNDFVFCAARLDGDPPPPACAVDLDGDGQVLATTDSLMHNRIALGLADTAVTNGINFPPGAMRTSWSAINAYLVGKTLDIDGDGLTTSAVDSLIHIRVALGITGSAAVSDITFAPTATRKSWPLIRDYLVTQCGMLLTP